MKLYRSLGRIWTGTQADAKKAQDGKDFEEIDVPTDKPGLMAWLNTFDVRPGDVKTFDAVQDAVYGADTDELDEMLGMRGMDADDLASIHADHRVKLVTDHRPTHGPGSISAATSCAACARDAKVAAMVVDAEASINIRADIEDVMELETADDLIARLQRRRETLVAAAEDDAEDMLG